MDRRIYAVYDHKAQDIIGGLHLHSHDAAAVRMFHDIATMPQSGIGRHPADYDLICCGNVDGSGEITPTRQVVLTGAAWKAAHIAQEENSGA